MEKHFCHTSVRQLVVKRVYREVLPLQSFLEKTISSLGDSQNKHLVCDTDPPSYRALLRCTLVARTALTPPLPLNLSLEQTATQHEVLLLLYYSLSESPFDCVASDYCSFASWNNFKGTNQSYLGSGLQEGIGIWLPFFF